MSQTKETAKRGSRRPRPARPEDGEEAKRPGISQGKRKRAGRRQEKTEKAGEIRKEGDDGERPIGQATPAAQGSEAANGGSAVVPTQAPLPAGVGAAAEAEIIPADGNGSRRGCGEGRFRSGWDGHGPAGDGRREAGDGATEHGGSNIEAAAETEAEAGAVIWDGRAVRSAMEQMARRVTEAGEITRAQQQESWEQQGRLAALESRLRRLEEAGAD